MNREQDHPECSHNRDQYHNQESHGPPSRSRAIARLLEGDPQTLEWGLASIPHPSTALRRRTVIGKLAHAPLLEEVETHDRTSSLFGGCDNQGFMAKPSS